MKLDLQACTARHPAAKSGALDALSNLSLAVSSGEQLAIIGPSGAGKTTLLQLLACAQRPEQGAYLMDGGNPWQLSSSALRRQRGQIFLAPQVPPLPPRQRVVSAVLAGRLPEMSLLESLQSLFYPRDTDLAESALAQFDLAEKLFERVDRLSGGERQRVGLARMLASNASLLLVDEPLSALDPERARQALQAICTAALERGATLVTSLHHVEMALANFPRIVGLRAGELVFDLPSEQVTEPILQSLYASNLEELTGPAPRMDDAPAPLVRVAMQCR